MALPRTSLTAAGIDPAGVADFLAACAADATTQLHAALIIRGGRVAFEAHWAPYTADQPRLIYSLSKLFTSAATGIAVADGAFGYDDTLADLFAPAVDPRTLGRKARRITIRHCLAMTTGHEVDHDLTEALSSADLSGFGWWLRQEPTGTPGQTFCYNQHAPYACSAAISARTGRDAHTLLTERVFGPLGADPGWWAKDAGGRAYGWSHLHVVPETIAAFAQLVAAGGVHDGVQLLPPEWLAEVSRVHSHPESENADSRRGYGWQVWMSRHGFRGDGAYGQFALFFPEADAIVVLLGAAEDAQFVLDQVWEHLYPAFFRAPSAPEEPLLRAAAGFALATPAPDAPGAGPARLVTSGEAGDFELTRADAGWTLRWRDRRGGDSELTVGEGTWARGELTFPGHTLPVAAAGAFAGDVFTARLVFVTTPHAAVLTLDAAGATLRWETTPLIGAEPAWIAFTSGTRRPQGDTHAALGLLGVGD